jgi:peptide/nickel transport system substrate-binding protein
MPGGGRDLRLRYAQRSESVIEPQVTEFITGWLEDIGIATKVQVYDDSELTEQIGAGTYDLFVWGWTPFVDPDTQLSYFTCDQVTTDVKNILYNDANWCSEEYDALYEQQKVELDPARRREIVHEMILMFYEAAPYAVLFEDADLQAYRTDRFEGWVKQPADTGPVLFSNTSPTYARLVPVGAGPAAAPGTTTVGTSVAGAPGAGTGATAPEATSAANEAPATTAAASDDDDGGANVGLIVAIVAIVAVLGVGGWLVARRRGTQDDRE